MARRFSPRNTFRHGSPPAEPQQLADESLPVSPDDTSQSRPDEILPSPSEGLLSSVRPPQNVTAQIDSVLEVGVSPWMGRADKSKPSASVDAPYSSGAALVSVAKNSPIFQSLPTGQSKEYRIAERKRNAELKESEERELAEWERENLPRCRYYFYIGCLGLPLIHFVSVYYYLKQLKGHDRDFKIKKYIYLSLLVGIIQVFLWILWIVIFQLLRDDTLKEVNILNSQNYTVGSLV